MADFRKLVLRILLMALAISAVVGALAVLTAGNAVAWRVVGTALSTAFAAGFILPLTLLGDHEKSRGAGVFGIALVVAEFLLSLVLIWDFSLNTIGFSHVAEDIGLSMLWLAMTGVPCIFFLSIVYRTGGRIAGLLGVAIAFATLMLLLVGTWLPGSFRDSDKWFGTASTVGGIGLCAIASSAGAGFRWWRVLGLIASTFAIGVTTYAIWTDLHGNGGAFACMLSGAIVLAHANLCMLCVLTHGQQWLRWVTIGATIVTAVLIDALVINDNWSDAKLPLANLAGASGIIAGCGSLALLVLARLNRGFAAPPVLTDIRQITLLCPACKKKQTLAIATSDSSPAPACRNCGLRIAVKVSEPRCAKCDYVLLMLKSDRCPECGTPVNAAAGAAV